MTGWGGRATTDGNDAQIVPHGNCRNTPIEVLETRYPWINEVYRLNDDCGGASTEQPLSEIQPCCRWHG